MRQLKYLMSLAVGILLAAMIGTTGANAHSCGHTAKHTMTHAKGKVVKKVRYKKAAMHHHHGKRKVVKKYAPKKKVMKKAKKRVVYKFVPAKKAKKRVVKVRAGSCGTYKYWDKKAKACKDARDKK